MTEDFYIPRTLLLEDRALPDVALIGLGGVIVVLAEPGAGKTELLNSLARQLGVKRKKASIFKHESVGTTGPNALVLDALDEVAKLDPSGVDALLVKAKETGARQVVLASRSSEWESARNVQIEECFGIEPKILRLQPFNEEEQEQLFAYYFPDQSFTRFKEEVNRFDLESLLGNPQFLKLMGEAYIEGGRKFENKRSIFEGSVRRLTQVLSGGVPQKDMPNIEDRISWSEELFAKLLMSGSVGVSVQDEAIDRSFPNISLLLSNVRKRSSILDTRLFKPSDNPNQHEPVHRIVAEYCAARYIAKRVDDSSDHLTLGQSMAVIAPNSVVRDELRGLLAWTAALGSKVLQEAAIDLDPYAVLSNGDPSQLLPSSKKRLLDKIKVVAESDPYFRRSDIWRNFSGSGFFTLDVVDQLRPIIASAADDGHLKDLMLEILEGSDAVPMLAPELRGLMLDPMGNTSTRVLAHKCLMAIPEHDHLSDCGTLIAQGSRDSLAIAARLFQELGVAELGRANLLGLLQRSADLYPDRKQRRASVIGARYFVKQLIRTLELQDVEWLLDQLTVDLRCTCGAKGAYECDCRNGISKIVGSLLDQFFQLDEGPYQPAQILRWVYNLNFHNGISADRSESVRVLQSDHGLRQGMQRLVLGGLTDRDEIWNRQVELLHSQGHAGLRFQSEDVRAMVDLAFETDNAVLWSAFLARHIPYRTEHGPDDLRHQMRAQANAKPELMKVWAKQNRGARQMFRQVQGRANWSARRWRRRERRNQDASAKHLAENRELVEAGCHWEWLWRFADYYLIQPDKLSELTEDRKLVNNALGNCLPFLAPYVPSLEDLGLGRWRQVARVLHAACVVTFRDKGNLDGIDRSVLSAVKTDVGGYQGIEEDEAEAFEAELNRCLFSSVDDLEEFMRAYVEPQLMQGSRGYTDAGLLAYKEEFAPIRSKLSMEWLTRFRVLPHNTLSTLFDLGVRYADGRAIQDLISLRCAEFVFFWPDKTEDEELEARRRFWFMRHYYFIHDGPEVVWEWLSAEEDTIFALEQISGLLNRRENVDWPDLSAVKVFQVLDAFVDKWSKVCLPSSFGTDSPKEEKAYRFLTNIIWTIGRDDSDNSIPVLNNLIGDGRFRDFHKVAQNLRATALREKALRDFEPPTPTEIVKLLDEGTVATVEGLRALLIEELSELQRAITGGEFDTVELFYDGGKRVDENTASKRIAERLQLRLNVRNMAVNIEHHLKNARRCDITASKMIGGSRRLIVTEVKGQWHPELLTAASEQLHDRYSIHPDAEQQGIYLVLWFGSGEKIAGKIDASIASPSDLREKVVQSVPEELRGLLDVFVLDLSIR